MPTIKFEEPRDFHVDGGWYDAHWLRQARADFTRSIARVLAASAARFRRWLVNMIWARDVLSALPAEGSPCTHGDEVDRVRHLLLDHEGAGDRIG